jgi:predicted RNA-binding protein YlqC (UPF0109 family)
MSDESEQDALDDGDEAPIEQMQELIGYVAKQLVDDTAAVKVDAVDSDRAIVFELSVAESDLGKVIGRDGRTARALRTLLAATSAKLRKRAVLEILE